MPWTMPTAAQLIHETAFQRYWFRLLVALVASVTLAALSPGHSAPSMGFGDKYEHLLAFGALALVATWSRPAGASALWITGAALLAYGGCIEIAQLAVPGRDSSWADLAADAAGIAAGQAAAVGLRNLLPLRGM